eukprot:TRINITY_DN6940_c0_g2_i1.p1 TRINITY_DN6940_c0_g2~~TRINITY_DN6940_c0_g2_i1.p1  ORF type:complete len:543 (-),score=140.84 TRINITY_DN6940_c0_g2_i1:136-1734(-)
MKDILSVNPAGLKVQLKPDVKALPENSTPPSLPNAVKVVVKWGGEITDSGAKQSRVFGEEFRAAMLKLKNESAKDSFLENCQVFSSDEDRVKYTAFHFVQGFLKLDPEEKDQSSKVEGKNDGSGNASRCNSPRRRPTLKQNFKTQELLDDTSRAKDECNKAKEFIQSLFVETSSNSLVVPSELAPRLSSIDEKQEKAKEIALDSSEKRGTSKSVDEKKLASLEDVPSSRTSLISPAAPLRSQLEYLYNLVQDLVARLVEEESFCETDDVELRLMRSRWEKLMEDIFDVEKNEFDTSKIPDVYDCAKYEAIHSLGLVKRNNKEFVETVMQPLYDVAKELADLVIPLEYGVDAEQKKKIGVQIGLPLLAQIVGNLKSCVESPFGSDSPRSPMSNSKCFLYFTSESHLNALRNMVMHSSMPLNTTISSNLHNMELNYFSHVVFQLYAKTDAERIHETVTAITTEPGGLDSHDDSCGEVLPHQYFVRVQFSPGAVQNPFVATDPVTFVLPVSLPMPVNGKITLEQLEHIVEDFKKL